MFRLPKPAPLTPEQQARVLEFTETIATQSGCVYWHLIRQFGRDEFIQVGWVSACVAVSRYDPDLDPKKDMDAYVRLRIRQGMIDAARRLRFWAHTWEQAPEGLEYSTAIIDYRRAESHENPALHAWCSDEFKRQRRYLSWKQRIVLYLRCVEGWTQVEVAETLGLVHSNVSYIEKVAGLKIASGGLKRSEIVVHVAGGST